MPLKGQHIIFTGPIKHVALLGWCPGNTNVKISPRKPRFRGSKINKNKQGLPISRSGLSATQYSSASNNICLAEKSWQSYFFPLLLPILIQACCGEPKLLNKIAKRSDMYVCFFPHPSFSLTRANQSCRLLSALHHGSLACRPHVGNVCAIRPLGWNVAPVSHNLGVHRIPAEHCLYQLLLCVREKWGGLVPYSIRLTCSSRKFNKSLGDNIIMNS